MKNNFRNLGYSQNFLVNPTLVSELVKRSGIKPDDLVYEIGPGRGIITEQLAKNCQQVIAIEHDKKLFSELIVKFRVLKNIKLISGDFLKFDLPSTGHYKIFANIPFDLTAEIINKLTMASNPPTVSYLIVQEEAARKYAGQP